MCFPDFIGLRPLGLPFCARPGRKKYRSAARMIFFPEISADALPPYLCVRVRLMGFKKNKDRIRKIAAQDQAKYFHFRACL